MTRSRIIDLSVGQPASKSRSVTLVTGASSGIGAALARVEQMAESGRSGVSPRARLVSPRAVG
jgi:hypothetical protein